MVTGLLFCTSLNRLVYIITLFTGNITIINPPFDINKYIYIPLTRLPLHITLLDVQTAQPRPFVTPSDP